MNANRFEFSPVRNFMCAAASVVEHSERVTLGEAPVTAAGAWSPKSPYTLSYTGNTITVPVPFASAVLITAH